MLEGRRGDWWHGTEVMVQVVYTSECVACEHDQVLGRPVVQLWTEGVVADSGPRNHTTV